MVRLKFLRILLLLAISVTLLFPLYTVYYQYPSFTRLLKENVTNETTRLAGHLSSLLITGNDGLNSKNIPPALIRNIQSLERDSHFIKIKIFSSTGEILYSTFSKEIGDINREAYFHDIMRTGEPYALEVPKDTASLERQFMSADVVETYTPILKDNKMIGIFEIYYDISAENAKLHSLVRRSSAALFGLMVVLLGMVVFSTVKARSSMKERERAEEERERLIVELQGALANVKTLKGLLPVCAWCKNVRDDKGYWKQVEEYIAEHSDAKFTHGICPECFAKVSPGVNGGLSRSDQEERGGCRQPDV